ncbi:MAG: ferredoxin-thioredoxin reductase catalytic domain-containing protein [Chitinivibrionales bacterium]|nr:ferredoxin-thioredoxin reductase catalytic domain-containing protein [Chitinivibrionales bacterium]
MRKSPPDKIAAPSVQEIKDLDKRLRDEAEASGYHLNPDVEFTRDLAAGLLVNEKRYGYWSCPCRLASGDKQRDLDIICPCDYRDPDLAEHGACFCALYVNDAILQGKQKAKSIPERRPNARRVAQPKQAAQSGGATGMKFPYPVWRCKVCGYLCGRNEPPEKCPICKASKERFERFAG